LLQDFAVVQGRVWKDGTPRWQFICKAHGTKTENKRNLESRKRKDEEGKVVSDRQRDTMIKAKKDCGFEYLLSHKAVSKGSKDKEYIGTLKCLNHTHPLYLNPFSFKVHEKSTVEYQALVAQAREYRIGKSSYAESQELLEQELLGMTISQKTYYNLLQKKLGDSSNPGTIDGLLAVLNEASFTFRCRTKDEMEGDRIIKRKLIQIVFFHKEAIRFGQRFITGKVLMVDGTFNTNKLRMLLLIGVGITNSNKIFPLDYSYCPGETVESYDFFFETLREEVFFDDILGPAVIMGDQAPGLIKAVDVLDSIPNAMLQFCNWHAVEAMRAKFNKAGYTIEDIDGYTEG
jgi:MULE transposase domain